MSSLTTLACMVGEPCTVTLVHPGGAWSASQVRIGLDGCAYPDAASWPDIPGFTLPALASHTTAGPSGETLVVRGAAAGGSGAWP